MESLFWNCRTSFLFLHKEFTFSSTSASAGSSASRTVKSVQHLFLSRWWLWGGHSHNCHIHKPVIHCVYDSSAMHTGWEEIIRQQKWNTLWKQKSPHDFTSNFSGSSFSSVPGHKTATINWSAWVLSNSLRSSQEIYSHTRKFSPMNILHVMTSQGVCPYWSQKDSRIIMLILLKYICY